ncbi:beta-ketoacyl synthase N-terminal-like domain-containing protein [Amycolatopsis sp. PS_44_ISF1]|uniref:beta-ketoacyl synthase N-terminal-like domain-containing protein n=1 Tax=Amycolatopsis sp. PS_44_ISF1 TaxID=2974917 RepID=UPI0028DEE8BD|nr:beta-ketoacyl synthase N-terminal-like domain-containing protein [Amycolatopsis sp. PS_44_ISF1]MDT8912981.1 polyketide synthase dehydratase domain-containing protein [Amycolatopsis sp. PS_44_ISF1]
MPRPGTDQAGVAIVGMGVLLPGAATLGQFWHNLETGADTITEIPEHRRDPGFHGRPGTAPDRTHGRRGGFVGERLELDATGLGVLPAALPGTEPDQIAALAVASAAIDDLGGPGRLGDRERVGVVLGRGGYLSPGLRAFDQRVRTVREVTGVLADLAPSAGPELVAEVRRALLEPLGPFRPEAAAGLVPNLAASRVANRLDLGGPAYTVDAACASSLLAVDQAIGELARGRCDAVLAGGVHHTHDDTLWSLFTQLGALSPSQRISPFSRHADGMLIGEGTAIVVLKRLEDARRDGDRVYAVVCGSGTSSDGRAAGLLSPASAGQVRALRRAWRGADPARIGLVEAHGTATPAGDAAELATLAEVFGPAAGPRAVLGSVKSMIGHTLPTAGAAGLVKAALALHHGVLPPSLHCEEPNPLLAGTRFEVLAEARPWTGLPRVAAVNAFGFGGVNAHVVLTGADRSARRRARVEEPERVLRLAAASPRELLDRLEDRDGEPGAGPCRIAVAGPGERKLGLARRVVAEAARTGRPWHGAGDVWCSVDPLLPGGRTVFLYPGLEDTAEPRCDDVARRFGLDRPRWSAGTVLERAAAVTATGRVLGAALRRIAVRPDALAGHSVGEWTAMQEAGMYPGAPLSELLGRYWPDGFELPEVDYLVLGCPAARLAEALPAELVISHENAPRQTVVCGPPPAVAGFAESCRADGIVTRALSFRSGFHSPFLLAHLEPFARFVGELPLVAPSVPVWSATTARPYPADPDGVRELYLAHLLERVRFRQLAEQLHEAGFRAFVQVGAGQLGSFVADTLGQRPHLAVAAASTTRAGLAQLRRAAAALWAEGAEPDFAALEPERVRLNPGPGLLRLGDAARGLLDRPAPAALPVVSAGVPAVVPEGGPSVVSAGVPAVVPEGGPSVVSAGVPAVVPEGGPSVVSAGVPAALSEGGSPVLPAGVPAVVPEGGPLVVPAGVPAVVPAGGPPVVLEGGPAALPEGVPAAVVAEFTALLEEIRRAAAEVAAAAASGSTVEVSLEAMPHLRDHRFFRQREGWPDESDFRPVVPATALVGLACRAAERHAPGTRAIEVRDAVFSRWLIAEPARRVPVTTSRSGALVSVHIGAFARMDVRLGPGFPAAPEPFPPPGEEGPPPLAAAEVYRQREMFHGPAYQGLARIDALGARHIRGELVVPPAPGGLLDNVGQLLGCWLMAGESDGLLAFPRSIGRITWYGPEPGPGTRVGCLVRIRHLDPDLVEMDAELRHEGRVLARIGRWADVRFPCDRAAHRVHAFPERNLLSRRHEEGWVWVADRWPTVAARDLYAGMYLDAEERAAFEACETRRRGAWLLERIAVKDAVRARLDEPVFPAEIHVHEDGSVSGRHGRVLPELEVALARDGNVAAALALERAEGCPSITLRRDGPGAPISGHVVAWHVKDRSTS